MRRRAASASDRSSHGTGPSAPMIERSWPLPASRTTSPGRARLEGGHDRGAPVGDQQQVVPAALAAGLGAPRDLVEDRVAVLAARVLVGDDHESCPFGRDPAHERPLRRVALARRPEDRHDAAAAGRGHRRQQVEHGAERCRAVRVVDHDPERLAELDALHAAGHDLERGQPVADRGRVEPDGLAERDHGQRVVGVEPAREPELERAGTRRRLVGDAQAVGVLLDPRRADVGRRVRPVAEDPRARLLGHPDEAAGRRVVGIDDPGPRPAGAVRLGTPAGSRPSRSKSDSFAST